MRVLLSGHTAPLYSVPSVSRFATGSGSYSSLSACAPFYVYRAYSTVVTFHCTFSICVRLGVQPIPQFFPNGNGLDSEPTSALAHSRM